jgi:hypothetical protein
MSQRIVSYTSDIRPLFTELDRDHMSFMFDLWSYDDVKNNADDIYDAVSNKRMPPAPPKADGPWSQEKIDTFKEWVDGGFQP